MKHRDMCPAHLADESHADESHAAESPGSGRSAGHHSAAPGPSTGEPGPDRLSRNWNEILQKLRVTQTGSQILTGFLLTLPFQQRFSDLDTFQVSVYLVLVVVATLTTVVSLTP